MAKKFITALDVEYHHEQGGTELVVDQDVIVTAVAMEMAERLGVIITRQAAQAQSVRTAPAPAPSRPAPAAAPAAVPAAAPAPAPARVTVRPAARPVSTGPVDLEALPAQWRSEFPILERHVHVGNCSQSPESNRVRNAIDAYLDNWLTVGMDWDYWIQEVIKAKTEFAKLINADPDEIAVSTSVSECTSSLASGLDFSRRRKVVATEAEFPTVGHVWLAHQKYGCKVEFVPVKDGQIRFPDYERYIDDDTVIASVTHVYYQNGYKQQLKPIVDLAHERGALVYVDAYQSLGTTPLDVKELGVDMLSTGNLKYLLGIPGIAFLYVKREVLPKLKPAVTGWFGQENPFAFKVHYLDYASDSRRFETGTPPVISAFAARAGMEIINEVGVENIARHIDGLSAYALEGARARGLRVASPFDVSIKGATTAIEVPDSHHVEVELKRKGIIGSARGNVIRVAPHFFIRPADIDQTLDAIVTILSHG